MKVRCDCVHKFEDAEKVEPLSRKKRSRWSRRFAKVQMGVLSDSYLANSQEVVSYEELVEKGGYSR